MPTRDRPRLADATLRSYIENALEFGRMPEIVVIDDSRRRQNIDSLARRLTAIRREFGVTIHRFDRLDRVRYAERLAKLSVVDERLVKFAVLGSRPADITTGASRNALLLACMGKPHIQVDDDSLCRLTTHTDQDDGLALVSTRDGMEKTLYSSRREALEACKWPLVDFIGIHERMLERSVEECIDMFRPNIHIDDMDTGFTRRMRALDGYIAITSAGLLGDAGNVGNAFMAFDEYTAEHLLTRNDIYGNLGSRNIMMMAPRTTIHDGGFCMSGNLGCYNVNLMPPFLPVHRNEDGVFGHVLKSCFINAYHCLLPYALCHFPEDSRQNPAIWWYGGADVRIGTLLTLVIRSSPAMDSDISGDQGLSRLGRFLKDLGSTRSQEFAEYVEARVSSEIIARIETIDRQMFRTAGTTYAMDLASLRELLLQRLLDPKSSIAVDLPGAYNERITLCKNVVRKYGTLLLCWSELASAAIALREKSRDSTGGA